MKEWHSIPIKALWNELDSGPEGLTRREAAERLERWGDNELKPPPGPSMPARILAQLKAMGYEGALVTEHFGCRDTIAAMKKSAEYIRERWNA